MYGHSYFRTKWSDWVVHVKYLYVDINIQLHLIHVLQFAFLNRCVFIMCSHQLKAVMSLCGMWRFLKCPVEGNSVPILNEMPSFFDNFSLSKIVSSRQARSAEMFWITESNMAQSRFIKKADHYPPFATVTIMIIAVSIHLDSQFFLHSWNYRTSFKFKKS